MDEDTLCAKNQGVEQGDALVVGHFVLMSAAEGLQAPLREGLGVGVGWGPVSEIQG